MICQEAYRKTGKPLKHDDVLMTCSDHHAFSKSLHLTQSNKRNDDEIPLKERPSTLCSHFSNTASIRKRRKAIRQESVRKSTNQGRAM